MDGEGMSKKNCETCKYKEHKFSELPCNICSGEFDKWKEDGSEIAALQSDLAAAQKEIERLNLGWKTSNMKCREIEQENEELREQLRLANIDAANELAENAELRARLKPIEDYSKLVNKPYEIEDTIWVSGIIAQELKVYRTQFKITGIEVLDGEKTYTCRPCGYFSQHYVLPCMIDGYKFVCPTCGQSEFIKGKAVKP